MLYLNMAAAAVMNRLPSAQVEMAGAKISAAGFESRTPDRLDETAVVFHVVADTRIQDQYGMMSGDTLARKGWLPAIVKETQRDGKSFEFTASKL